MMGHTRHSWFGVLCAMLALLVASHSALSTESFELQVNDISGLDEPWPLVGGLPFPKGVLRDPEHIRVLDDGEEVSAQINVAATWRDGSIRWAHVSFTAPPNGEYAVEFGPDVARREPEAPLTVRRGDDGALTINTGAAVYEFEPDKLLPERGTMGDAMVLRDAGDGTYLVDNEGRTARVSGAKAKVTSELCERGPARLVLHRKGWYVTEEGERVARAKMWFYFAHDSPYIRMTHSLVLTRNTNEWWVHDYGLELDTPQPANEVAFALSNPAPKETLSQSEARDVFKQGEYEDLGLMFSGMRGRKWRMFTTKPDDDEVYMLQENYPHHFERGFNAVIGRVSPQWRETLDQSKGARDNRWLHEWEKQIEVAGDWADARYDDHALTVVTPWLAQRFPKEIAFGPDGARVAFWSGRSGRDLDYRPITLVNEYWKKWAKAASSDQRNGFRNSRAVQLAAMEVDAAGAARTHDFWLLPRRGGDKLHMIKARATAAARPPLLMADPEWLTSTEAIGWPMHPKNPKRFPKLERVLSEYWNGLFAHTHTPRPTGFIDWGRPPFIQSSSHHFRIGLMIDYCLRRNAWSLYARSGERRYYEFATRFNRISGDYSVAHWTGGNGKLRGAFVAPYRDPPFFWGHGSQMWKGLSGQSVKNWLLGYYLTGDEYAHHMVRMVSETYKNKWGKIDVETRLKESNVHPILLRLVDLYTWQWDEDFRRMAEQWARGLIDLDNPTGRSDTTNYGVLYKGYRQLYSLYMYYRATKDPLAKKALLKGLDYRYRFHRVFSTFAKGWAGLLYSEAYRWTGRRAYLRLVKQLLDTARSGPPGRPRIHHAWHVFGGLPSAMGVVAEVDESQIGPYPVLETDKPRPIAFRKRAEEPVRMSIFVRMSDDVAKDAKTVVQVRSQETGQRVQTVKAEVEQLFPTKYEGRRDPRQRHVSLTVPAEVPAGRYTLHSPNIETIVVLESSASDIGLSAPRE